MSYKFLKREDHLIGVDYTESEEKELEEKLEEKLEEYNSGSNCFLLDSIIHHF